MRAGQINKLSADILDSAADGTHSDGGGLFLKVSGPTRDWLFRFTQDRRKRDLDLGSAALVSLDRARQMAADARENLRRGLAPVGERDRGRDALDRTGLQDRPQAGEHPASGRQYAPPVYETTIETHGIRIPYVPNVISPRMKDVMQKNRYEAGEAFMARSIIQAGDVVLELGAGVGLISTLGAQITAPENIIVVEANPDLIPVIRETHKLNGADGITVHSGLAVAEPDETAPAAQFHLRSNFWASSLEPPHEGEVVRTVDVRQISVNAIVRERKPAIVFMDIEGAEQDLLRDMDLSTIRHLVVEIHPRVYGLQGSHSIFEAVHRKGLTYDAKRSRGGTVVVFSRALEPSAQKTRVTAITCMKDEGPFILEWIAYHRLIGITDFVIFTNDCSDETVPMLDRLDEIGLVRHLANPSMVMDRARHQPTAIAYASLLKEVRNADWVISMDVDEFINIHVGNGTIDDLVAALPDAHAISLAHLDFGNSGRAEFDEGLVVEQFQMALTREPDHRERRGIKTFVRRDAPEHRIANHRPVFKDPDTNWPEWYDGGGRRHGPKLVKSARKGIDARGAYSLAQLNHYPVKSNETYLVKSAKGDVVAHDARVGIEYWQLRNRNDERDASILARVPDLKSEMSRLLEDPKLRDLQARAVLGHRRQIDELRAQADGKKLLEHMAQLDAKALK